MHKNMNNLWCFIGSSGLVLALGCTQGAVGPTASAADANGRAGAADSLTEDANALDSNVSNDTAGGQGGPDTLTALPIPTGLTLLGTAKTPGVQAQLFAAQPLFTGMNTVFYRFQNAQGVLMEGQVTHQAQLAAVPPQGCPAVQPLAQADGDALFEGLLIPQLPSTGDKNWKVVVEFTQPSAATPLKFEFADVPAVAMPVVKTLKGADSHSYVVAVRLAGKAKLGKNPLTFSVHRANADGLTYTAVTDATIKLTTLMVSMGHGSNGNVSPVHKSSGLYDGTVAFSMPGDWRITFAITLQGATVGTASFDLKI